ncbi:MAG: M67 family metallopeptidase [Candidatus Promineifilaceae bacterium]|nr:M67 family metallopeptidase [Candidatus Promineifilaceae bacterium]
MPLPKAGSSLPEHRQSDSASDPPTLPPTGARAGGSVASTEERAPLRLARGHLRDILAHLRAVYPLEGCGLLAGRDGRVCAVHPVENRLHSPHGYEMAPAAQIRIMYALEAAGQELLAIYHSHPHGPAYPSPADVAGARYPGVRHLVVSLAAPAQPVLRAFAIDAQGVQEVLVEIV